MLKRQLRGCFRLCAIHARLETRDRAPEAAGALIEQLQRGHQSRLHPWLQHHGNANVRRLPDVQPGETWRRYSDDSELVSVQENALSNNPSIGVQTAREEVGQTIADGSQAAPSAFGEKLVPRNNGTPSTRK